MSGSTQLHIEHIHLLGIGHVVGMLSVRDVIRFSPFHRESWIDVFSISFLQEQIYVISVDNF